MPLGLKKHWNVELRSYQVVTRQRCVVGRIEGNTSTNFNWKALMHWLVTYSPPVETASNSKQDN